MEILQKNQLVGHHQSAAIDRADHRDRETEKLNESRLRRFLCRLGHLSEIGTAIFPRFHSHLVKFKDLSRYRQNLQQSLGQSQIKSDNDNRGLDDPLLH